MTRRYQRHRIWILGAGLVVTSPVAGDWLVTRDGSRVETYGAWEVKGGQVIFTRPGGTLAAMRLIDVDLGASETATADSRAAPAGPSGAVSERRKPVLVLTNDDFRSLGPESGEDEKGGSDEDSKAEAESVAGDSTAEAVRLVTWAGREDPDLDGMEITGTVHNSGEYLAAAIRVYVTALDDEGRAVESQAFLQHSSLAPGQKSLFRARLPGLYTLIEDPAFEIRSEAFGIPRPVSPSVSTDGARDDEVGPGEAEGLDTDPPPKPAP